MLFDLATARLLERKVLLPGPTVLARLVAAVREHAATELWQTPSHATTTAQKQALLGLLTVPAAERTSGLERLRRGPASVTATGMLGALARLAEIQALGVGDVDLTGVPPGRLAALSRHATAAKAQTVARMTPDWRDATLLAAARHLQAAATDDALDLLDQVLGSLLGRAQRAGRQERMRTLPELDVAATHLRDAVKVLLDPPAGDLAAVWAAITGKVSRAQLEAAVAAVGQTTRPDVDTHLTDLLSRYTTVRRFLPALLTTMTSTTTATTPTLRAAPGGVEALEAFTALAALEGRRTVKAAEVPLALATGAWERRCTNPDGTLNRPAYTFLVLEWLREALRRRDVYAPGSTRWGDPRAQLLTGPAWDTTRPQVTRSLGLSPDPRVELTALAAEYRAVSSRLLGNGAVRIEATAAAATGPSSHPWTDWRSRPPCSRCAPPSTPCSRGSTCPTCCSRSPGGPASSPSSPTSPRAPPAPPTSGSASARSWSPRPATSAWNPSSNPESRRCRGAGCPGSTRTTSARRRSPRRPPGWSTPRPTFRWRRRGAAAT